MQEKYINIKTLKVSEKLSQLISDELLKETDLFVDNFWSKENEKTISWNSKLLNIKWPKIKSKKYILSKKDKKNE